MCCTPAEAALSCCPDKRYVQDKICAPWNGTVDDTAVVITVYNNNISQNIYGSGYVQYDAGPEDRHPHRAGRSGQHAEHRDARAGYEHLLHLPPLRDHPAHAARRGRHVPGRVLHHTTLCDMNGGRSERRTGAVPCSASRRRLWRDVVPQDRFMKRRHAFC